MAKAEKDVNEEESENQEESSKKKGGKLKFILLTVVGIVVLVAGSIAGTIYVLQPIIAEQITMAVEQANRPEGEQEEEEDLVDRGPVKYIRLNPPFTINLNESTRMLRVSMAVMVYGDDAEDAIVDYMPQVRNGLVVQLGDINAETIVTREGKDKLRNTALDSIRNTVVDYVEGEDIVEVFFTDFVLQ